MLTLFGENEEASFPARSRIREFVPGETVVFQREHDGSKDGNIITCFVDISRTELAFCAISGTPDSYSMIRWPRKQCEGVVAAASDGDNRRCTWRQRTTLTTVECAGGE